MKNLPQEILDIICEYADVKCRNGRYMNQIAATDPRRDLLKNIPRIIREVKHNNSLQKYYRVLLPFCNIAYCPEEYNKIHLKSHPDICSFYCYSFFSATATEFIYNSRGCYKIKFSGEIMSFI